ncbi:MFS transporter [Pontibacter sp. G13]|uniref:MFS transporter n=1 Tax=Pontibacter sp. G13 TaxID=3074898 RepID=UPI00288A4D31|nr:MFS transporter [Pontibacter sp. G13]WNJ18140.1 MFS transporter [Pontibacter sp. G13]
MEKTLQLFKDAYSGHPREIWTLAILTFINRLGTMVIPFLSVYLTTVLDFSLQQAGILTGAFGAGAFVGAYVGGKLSDTYGPNKVMFVSLLTGGILLFCLQFATSFNALLTLIFVTSVFGEAYRPAMTTAVGDYVPKHQTSRSMSMIRLAINLGMAAAPAIGGFVAVSLGYKFLFWIDGITCMAAATYFGIASQHWKKLQQQAGESPKTQVKQEVSEGQKLVRPFQNPQYLLFLVSTLLLGFGFVQWFYTVPVFIKTEWGFDETYIGIVMGLSSFIMVMFEMPIVHYLEEKSMNRRAILAGLTIMTCSFLPFLMDGNLVWYFTAMLILTIGEILFLPFNNAIPVHVAPDKLRGEYMSYYWMTWSLVQVSGASLGLYLSEQFGFATFWKFVMVLGAISLLITFYLKEHGERKSSHS